MSAKSIVFAGLFSSFALGACAKEDVSCTEIDYKDLPFTVCNAASGLDLRLFLRNNADEIFGDFDAINAELKNTDNRLVFAMNAGMYHQDRRPVGLYIEDGVEFAKLNTNPGPGNFHLLPNGVFWIGQDGTGVTSANDFDAKDVTYATQSGPMLVIDGQLHPAFREKSTSLRIRNGVGQTADGHIYFVKSELPVNFHIFASLFLEELETPNALFLDGTVSKLYSGALKRNDKGAQMGPILGLVAPIP